MECLEMQGPKWSGELPTRKSHENCLAAHRSFRSSKTHGLEEGKEAFAAIEASKVMAAAE